MIFASTSNIGLIRKENQDALGYLKTDSGELFVVCDGVSGLPNGALASKTVVDSILAVFSSNSKGGPEIQVQTAMQKAQNAVMNTNPKPLGTTAVAVYLLKVQPMLVGVVTAAFTIFGIMTFAGCPEIIMCCMIFSIKAGAGAVFF